MKTYEAWFVRRREDLKHHLTMIIEADTKTDALQKFAKKFKIKDYTQLLDNQFRWWKQDWLCEFRGVAEVEEITCPHCQGKGKVAVNVTQQTTEGTD